MTTGLVFCLIVWQLSHRLTGHKMNTQIPKVLPIYPLKDHIVSPYMVIPLFFPREAIVVIEEAMRQSQMIGAEIGRAHV